MKRLIRPMMATLVTKPFNRPGWINEEKYDGFRMDPKLEPSSFNLLTIEDRLKGMDPWADFWKTFPILPDFKGRGKEDR